RLPQRIDGRPVLRRSTMGELSPPRRGDRDTLARIRRNREGVGTATIDGGSAHAQAGRVTARRTGAHRAHRAVASIGIALCLCASSASRLAAAGRDDDRSRSLRTDSPRLVSIDITWREPHTAHTGIEYSPDPRLGNELALELASGPVTFIRQPDQRHYAADIRLTSEQIAALKERNEKLKHLAVPAVHNEYKGRVQVGTELATP